MRYYVYALIDPTNDNKPFYIGKGIADRVKSHFKEAMSSEGADGLDVDISTIAENELEEYNNSKAESPKIRRLKDLFEQGYGYNAIARILAKNLDEPTALALEAFLIKSVYGLKHLTNIVEGENAERFRPYSNWDCIDGFDLIKSANSHARQNRIEKLQTMLAEKLDEPLLEIQKAFPNLVFDSPKIADSGELDIEAIIRGTRIKIFIRKKNIQIELRGRNKEQYKWMIGHFKKLEAEHLLRRGNVQVFLPNAWKGSKNMTTSIQVAIKRAKLLLEIANAENRKELSAEALLLLK
ncbi:GIY-YIG nuclease family protein [Clostridium estertheticum]|uniref:GIY-YIG nuclease family protein n=1 Tax=Clostridium estertheticum TaxID=238834 RepID=UPI0013E9120B|nr:GIY-YIG nuclease family protein [Clostridium estertheticum]MBZ9688488.1 GIY-YIG nuclease family protein [Clostridium estertheticum]